MSQGPAIVDFPIYRGQAIILRFGPVQNAPDPTLAGVHATFTLRQTVRTPDPPAFQQDATVTTVNGVTYLDVPMTKADTLALALGTYEGMLERTDAGAETPYTRATVHVRSDIRNAV